MIVSAATDAARRRRSFMENSFEEVVKEKCTFVLCEVSCWYAI
jgi:hypothetical protein